ncbi:SlyX family protein [Beijerinckia sp. L45]|uniref:SlyX family protein n=1 Tax=Beijerinckia sp. L45 TaxID=1641855 RepID=UPI00131DFCF7|nr:SlyX family protein [Beijerinckia sp. L45]
MTHSDLEARIATLEMRTMHQDRVIEDLNATITTQWRIIDGLARQMANLDDRLRDGAGGVPPEAPPPHY